MKADKLTALYYLYREMRISSLYMLNEVALHRKNRRKKCQLKT